MWNSTAFLGPLTSEVERILSCYEWSLFGIFLLANDNYLKIGMILRNISIWIMTDADDIKLIAKKQKLDLRETSWQHSIPDIEIQEERPEVNFM